MIKKTFVFIILLVHLQPLQGQFNGKLSYLPPLKGPFSFSGGFGELRLNHFHTGLDFRTAGQIGIPVLAAKSGTIVRVTVSPSGYGHALYLRHSDGNTTVYGHLSRFHPKIEEYVKSEEYRLKNFAVDLNISTDKFSFEKGDTIAWSGNTGSSGGPHLHFEIRNSESERPQNPLFYLTSIQDNSSPRITSLFLYPLSVASHVNKSRNKQKFETQCSKRNSTLRIQTLPEVFGEIGIGIQTEDDFNGIGLKCGIYSAELFVDQEFVFSFKMDHLAFDQGRYVNSHIDFEDLVKNRRWIHRLFLQPGNKMDIYSTNSDKGILHLTDGKIHQVKIVVADAFNNTNVLSFKLLSKKEILPTPHQVSYTKHFDFNQSNGFENSELKIGLPAESLYDNLNFEYLGETAKSSYFSQIHHIHNQFVPLHKAYFLAIKTHSIPYKYQSKALIVKIESSGRLNSVGGDYKEKWITAYPRAFGNFAVVLDTIPPVIKALSIKENKILINKSKIEFKITDNLSGIGSYRGEIDGSWVLFEYDAKTNTIFYLLDKQRITMNKTHNLVLSVDDERNNRTEYKANFYL